MISTSFLAPALLFLAAHACAAPHQSRQSSKGCGKAIPSDVELGTSTKQQIYSQSTGSKTQRDYLVHVPESYDNNKAVPLIFSFHGRKSTAPDQDRISQFSNATYGFEGITVLPQGLKGDAGVQQWQGDPDSKGVDDVKFTMELLDELSDTYCIDPARVYASGMSNGGGFTSILACDPTATAKIAAFAPVSAAIYLNNKTAELEPCKPSRNVVPILEFHGYEDGQIPYNRTALNSRSNGYSVGIQEWFEGWAKRDGFDPKNPEITYLCSGVRKVKMYSWDDTVVHYNVSNFNHNWPHDYASVDTVHSTCKDADATRVILAWFKKWSL